MTFFVAPMLAVLLKGLSPLILINYTFLRSIRVYNTLCDFACSYSNLKTKLDVICYIGYTTSFFHVSKPGVCSHFKANDIFTHLSF